MQDEAAIQRDDVGARLAALADDLKTARAQAAAYALALDVLGRVDCATGPAAVADIVIQLFTALFAAGEIRVSLVDACGHGFGVDAPDPADERAPAFVLSEDGLGFSVRLVHEGRLVGTVDIARLAVPAYRDRYENTALTIAPVAAMLLVHARSLHGLIAICAYCKRIRDAQGTWHVLEDYLSEHSEALFSHGVCPSCMKDASLAGDADAPAARRLSVDARG
jgi:hypothetical protein